MSICTVEDNFLDKEDFEALVNKIEGVTWFWTPNKVAEEIKSPIEGYEKENVGQYVHTVFDDYINYSDIGIFRPLLRKMDIASLVRMKINRNHQTNKHKVSGWHYDITDVNQNPQDNFTSVLYLDTNNGFTILEDGSTVESVANRFVTFKNNILHAGVTQTDTEIRTLINLNYFK